MSAQATLQFVSEPSEDADILLDLNDESPWITEADEFSLGAPDYEGEPGSYGVQLGNRTITIPIYIKGDESLAGPALTNLARIVMADAAWLRWQPTPTSEPVWLRTYRTAPQSLVWEEVYADQPHDSEWHLRLELLADPQMRGAREDVLVNATVRNDPAAATNGTYVDIPGVKGDLPAPAVLWGVASSWTEGRAPWLAFEPVDGTEPIPFVQAESAVLGVGTTLLVNDPTMSGTGQNRVRVRMSNGTGAQVYTRLGQMSLPSATKPGQYRVYAKVSLAGVVSRLTFRLGVGSSPENIRWAEETNVSAASVQALDLGEIAVGPADVQSFGYQGTPLARSPMMFLEVSAPELIGSGTFPNVDVIFDYFRLLPTEDCFGRMGISQPSAPTNKWAVLDGPSRAIYLIDSDSPFVAGARVIPGASPPIPRGDFPKVFPGTTRLHMVRPTGAAGATQVVSLSYYPCYLWARPVGG